MGNEGSRLATGQVSTTVNKEEENQNVGEGSNLDVDRFFDLSTLFDNAGLSAASAKYREESAVDIINTHKSSLQDWLNEVLKRQNEKVITEQQFCTFLETQQVDSKQCVQAFRQFDVEGQGFVDGAFMLLALSSGRTSSIRSDLATVKRHFLKCKHLLGAFDAYNEYSMACQDQSESILRHIVRNRPTSSAIQVTALSNYNCKVQLRLSTLKMAAETLLASDPMTGVGEDIGDTMVIEELTSVRSIISSYEVSTNSHQASQLFSGGTWESNGETTSHWIRLTVKPGVIVQELRIGVSANDGSYMPKLVSVSAGKTATTLRVIRNVDIPNTSGGDYLLVENLETHYPVIQIDIRRCHSGLNVKINGIKIKGYRFVAAKSSADDVPIDESLVIWFLQMISISVSSSLPNSAFLRDAVLAQSKLIFGNLQPLSLAPGNSTLSDRLTGNVVDQLYSFFDMLSKDTAEENRQNGLALLIRLSIAEGNLVKILANLCQLITCDIAELAVGNILADMERTQDTFFAQQSRCLKVTLAGCDGGVKTDGHGAECVLDSDVSSVYRSGDNKTCVNMFFKSNDVIRLTRVAINVEKGSTGPRCGLVFVFSHSGAFDVEEQVKAFEQYDCWRQEKYDVFAKARSAAGNSSVVEGPVAFFTVDDVWDEFEVKMDVQATGQYILVKFLEPRKTDAQRLGIISMKFVGLRQPSQHTSLTHVEENEAVEKIGGKIPVVTLCTKVLEFLANIMREQPKVSSKAAATRGRRKNSGVTVRGVSLKLFWDVFQLARNNNSLVLQHRVLQLLHSSLAYLVGREDSEDAAHSFMKLLQDIVDEEASSLSAAAEEILIDGVGVFFPDKKARKQLFLQMLKDQSATKKLQSKSSSLTLPSLCRFYSYDDPLALLDLPTSETATDKYDVTPVLTVMNVLVTACQQQQHATDSDRSHVVKLLGVLQTKLLVWCQCQRKDHAADADSVVLSQVAQAIVVQYADLYTPAVHSVLTELDKLPKDQRLSMFQAYNGDFLSSTLPEFILLLNFLADKLTVPSRVKVLHSLGGLTKRFAALSTSLPELFHGIESEFWATEDRPEETLKFWEVESKHNYDNDMHETRTFFCPGATSFLLEFDNRCVTERKYDYLEFTDTEGVKFRCHGSVGGEDWPVSKIIKSSQSLEFLFHSDGSTNEWGYLFKITAKGLLDNTINWIYDAYLSFCKLIGKLCGANLDARKGTAQQVSLHASEILNSDLWATLFRGGFLATGQLQRSLSGKMQAVKECDAGIFLYNVACQEEEQALLFTKLVKEHHKVNTKYLSVGGAEVDKVVIATFAALLWHTQSLREQIDRYAKSGDENQISDGVLLAYNAAESLRTALAEERQKYLADVEDAGADPVSTALNKAMFLLRFAGLSRVDMNNEKKKMFRQPSKQFNRMTSFIDTEVERKLGTTFIKYPSFRLVLEFVQDPAWSQEQVENILKDRVARAKAAAEAYTFTRGFITIICGNGKTAFETSLGLFLEELMQYQGRIGHHYMEGLEGCGLELESKVREAYYMLMRTLVNAVRGTNRTLLSKKESAYFDFIVACTLHLLNMNWQAYDLPVVEELRLAEFFHSLAIDNAAQPDCHKVPRDDEKEMQTYETTMKCIEKAEVDKKNTAIRAKLQFAVDVGTTSYLCDPCRVNISAARYRCLDCKDYDVCRYCFTGGITAPDLGHQAKHTMAFYWCKCDGCGGFIDGTRFHCNSCVDVDLCYGCWKTNKFPRRHNSDHNVEEIAMTTFCLSDEQSARLQPYLHQNALMMSQCLSLVVTAVLSSDQVDDGYVKAAMNIYKSSLNFNFEMLSCISDAVVNEPSAGKTDDAEMRKKTFASNLYDLVMGTVGSMIHEPKNVNLTYDICQAVVTEKHAACLLNLMQSRIYQEDEINRLAFFIIRKLLLHIPSCDVVFDSSVSVDQCDGLPQRPGYRTVQFLFELGVKCLENKGTDWCSFIIKTIQQLYHNTQWKEPVAYTLARNTAEMSTKSSIVSAFTLYVIAGFPDSIFVGNAVNYREDAGSSVGIVTAYWPLKNALFLRDIKTRRHRKFTSREDLVWKITNDLNCIAAIDTAASIEFARRIVSKLQQGETVTESDLWCLALILKGLLKSDVPDVTRCMANTEFVKLIVYLATSGTGLSRKWMVDDLETLAVKLYAKADWLPATRQEPRSDSNQSTAKKKSSPLDGLSDDVKRSLEFLHESFGCPLSLLRYYYEEQLSQNLNDLTDTIADMSSSPEMFADFLPIVPDDRSRLLEAAKKWTVHDDEPVGNKHEADTDADIGLHHVLTTSSSHLRLRQFRYYENAVEECNQTEQDLDEKIQLCADSAEDDEAALKQRKDESKSLLTAAIEKLPNQPEGYKSKVLNAVAVLYARKFLLSLLAANEVAVTELVTCCSSESLPYVLELLTQTEAPSTSAKAFEKVLKMWPADGLKSAVLTACDFLKYVSSNAVVCDSSAPEKDSPDNSYRKKVQIDGADFLVVAFDESCSTNDSDAELIISSSRDLQSDRRVFGGKGKIWSNFNMPGDKLYCQWSTHAAGFTFKFTVTAGRIGRFETGHAILKTLLSSPHALPLNDLWRRMIAVSCRQTGQLRVRCINLLNAILQSHGYRQQTDQMNKLMPVDLTLIAPLWKLQEVLMARNPNSVGSISRVSRALVELFYTVETLATHWNVTDEYLIAVTSADHVKRLIVQGVANVAATSLGIDYENIVTRTLKERSTIPTH